MQVLLPMLAVGGFIAVIIALMVVISVYATKQERKRSLEMKSAATLLGWQFAEEAPFNYLPNLDKFDLFNSGHSKQIKNLLYGEINGAKAALFDYIYTVGNGKNQHTSYNSVAYFEPRNLNISSFSLRPENVVHKMISALGYQDIDFGNRPIFSSKYLLRGSDEVGIRHTFNDALMAFYEANPGLCTDGGGNQIFIFRAGHRAPPHETQSFINWAYQLQSLFPRFG